MAKGFKCGGGGNERAVWIQAYPTEAALLADVPRSQTIGVVTGTTITRCCIQPTVPGSTEGWIWIKDNSSTWVSNHLMVINGTGNPPTNIPIFPSGCMQYINGAWKNKIAYFYKGGEWVQFSENVQDQYVVFNGKNTADYVGGWSSDVSSGVLSVISGGSQGWISAINLLSNVAIDISKYSTMHIVVNEYKDKGTFGIGTTNASEKYDKSVAITSAKEYTINVSDLNGKYYVKLASTGKQNNTNYYVSIGFSVSKVWLE